MPEQGNIHGPDGVLGSRSPRRFISSRSQRKFQLVILINRPGLDAPLAKITGKVRRKPVEGKHTLRPSKLHEAN